MVLSLVRHGRAGLGASHQLDVVDDKRKELKVLNTIRVFTAFDVISVAS